MPSFYYPGEEPDGVTDLQDKVLGLLEDAGIDTETNDKIVALIDAAEKAKLLEECYAADYARSQRD